MGLVKKNERRKHRDSMFKHERIHQITSSERVEAALFLSGELEAFNYWKSKGKITKGVNNEQVV